MTNEMRLIDANAYCKELYQERDYPNRSQEFMDAIEVAIADLCDMPTVDAKPVVHGRWIYHECVSSYDGAISGYSCSNCHAFVNEEVFDMDEFHKDFCGNCGADMRERSDGE